MRDTSVHKEQLEVTQVKEIARRNRQNLQWPTQISESSSITVQHTVFSFRFADAFYAKDACRIPVTPL